MKNKIKDVLLCIGVFYLTVIVVLMIITYCKSKTSIEFAVNSEYQEKINSYKETVNSLSDSSCKEYMQTLISQVEKDVNTKELNFKKHYENLNDNSLLSMYGKASENCHSLNTEIMIETKMPILFLTPSVIKDEIVGKYIYQYELSFSDIKTRNINEIYLLPVENNIQLNNELQIIEKLLEIIDWGKEV